MYVEASYKTHDWRGRLKSPQYTKLSDRGCLTFWYHMWGRDIGTLKVSLKTASESVIWSKTGDQGNQWLKASVPIDLSYTQTFQIYFDGYVAHQLGDYAEVLGDIAIDDVSVDRRDTCGGAPVTGTSAPSTKSSSIPPVGGGSTSRSSASASSQTSTGTNKPGSGGTNKPVSGGGPILPGAQKQSTTVGR